MSNEKFEKDVVERLARIEQHLVDLNKIEDERLEDWNKAKDQIGVNENNIIKIQGHIKTDWIKYGLLLLLWLSVVALNIGKFIGR